MVAKLTGKAQQGKGANKPSGKPAPQPVKKIETTYSQAKAKGGTAEAVTG